MRKLIDANVILRYLLGDHPQMSKFQVDFQQLKALNATHKVGDPMKFISISIKEMVVYLNFTQLECVLPAVQFKA